MNNTRIEELEDEQIVRLQKSQRGLDREDSVFRLHNFREQYMVCAESLSPIHHNLSLVMQVNADSYGSIAQTEGGRQEHQSGGQATGLKAFCLKIKEADFNRVDTTNSFVTIDAYGRKSRDRYLWFTAEV